MSKCLRCGELVSYEKDNEELICPICGWEVYAAKNFAKKNPIGSELRKKIDESVYSLRLEKDGIRYGEKLFPYRNITNIYLDIPYDAETEALFTLPPIPFKLYPFTTPRIGIRSESTIIKIFLCDGTKLHLFGDGTLYTYYVYRLLMEQTLQYRKRKYIHEIEKRGYFTFCNVRFYTERTIEYKGKKYRLDECKFSAAQTFVQIEFPKRRLFGIGKVIIPTISNTDVLISLASEYCGLSIH